MADAFLDTIAALITTAGYTVKKSTEPNHRVWDSLPLVLVSPAKKSVIGWIAFGFRNVVSDYEVVLVQGNNLDTTPGDAAAPPPDFQKTIIDLFHQNGPSMRAVNSWNAEVTGNADYNRRLLPKGYTYTSMTVHVAWVENSA